TRVFNAVDGKLAWPVLRHGGLVFNAAFSHDRQRILTAAENGVAQLWHFPAAQSDPVIALHPGDGIHDARITPDARWAVTAGVDHRAILWEIPVSAKRAELPHESEVMQAIPSEDATTIATLTSEHIFRLWTNVLSPQTGILLQLDGIDHIA